MKLPEPVIEFHGAFEHLFFLLSHFITRELVKGCWEEKIFRHVEAVINKAILIKV